MKKRLPPDIDIKSIGTLVGKNQQRTILYGVSGDSPVEAVEGITLSISSTEPYLRSFGYEVLDHSPESVDLSRLNDGAAVLVDHWSDQVGVTEKAWLDGSKGYATLRFSSGEYGSEVEQDIRDGIRRNVSIGYQVLEYGPVDPDELIDGIQVVHVTKWMPYEVSIVAVPADQTVGVGRSARNITTEQAASLQALLDSVPDIQSLLDAHTVNHGADDEEETETPEQTADEATAEALEDDTPITPDDAEAVEINEDTKSLQLLTDVTMQDGADQAASQTKAATTTGPTYSMESNHMKTNEDEVTNPSAGITLTPKEERSYNISKAILGAISGKRSGLEFDISQQIAQDSKKDTSGFFMPTSIRAFALGDPNTGGNLAFTQPGGDVIDYLRATSRVVQLGAQVLNLSAITAFPKLGSDIAANWVSEDGSNQAASSASVGQVILSPKTMVAGPVPYTLATLRAATYDVNSIITSNIYKSIAVSYDKAAVAGTGANGQPTGILNLSGLVSSSVQTSGSALTYASALDLWNIVAQKNANNGGTLSYLTCPQVITQARTTIRAGSNAQFIMLDDGTIGGFKCVDSNNVPQLLSNQYLIFGDFSSVLLGNWGAVDITVDNLTLAGSAKVQITGAMLGDVQVKHVESFAIAKQIKA